MEANKLNGLKVISISECEDRVDITTENSKFSIYHEQDCCESVGIVSAIYFPVTPFIIISCESTEDYNDSDSDPYGELKCRTTFNFKTDKGDFNIIWDGESNGYYGVSVDLHELKNNQYMAW